MIMHGLLYLAILNRENGQILFDFKNLTISKSYKKIDFLKAIKDQGIEFVDEGKERNVFNLQLKLGENQKPFIFYFVQSYQSIIFTVTKSLNNTLNSLVEKIIDEFDLVFNLKDNISFNAENFRMEIISILSKNISSLLLPIFLIPEIERIDVLSDTQNLIINQSKSYKHIDGILSIEDIIDETGLEQFIIQDGLFRLWLYHLVSFRYKNENWNIYLRTAKTPLYLDEGSEEYLKLVNLFNSNKIIKILNLLETEKSYQQLYHEMEITNIKLNKYLTVLLNNQIIRKKKEFIDVGKISDDLIPLLTLQGFSKEDFNILKELESISDNNKGLEEIALEINIDPERIKSLVDKFKKQHLNALTSMKNSKHKTEE
jgi:hypothetical protein